MRKISKVRRKHEKIPNYIACLQASNTVQKNMVGNEHCVLLF